MKIGIVGAPSAGKSCFSASLFSELLIQGAKSASIVTEYAQEYIGRHKKLDLMDQYVVSKNQILREQNIEDCGFNPIVCDSAIWMGSIYAEFSYNNLPIHHKRNWDYKTSRKNTVEMCDSYLTNHYDMVVYVPLIEHSSSQETAHRIHNNKDSIIIDRMIKHKINDTNACVFFAPKKIEHRNEFTKRTASVILQLTNR